MKINLIKGFIFTCLVFNISFAKIQYIPKNGKALPTDSIFIYVPPDSLIGKRIIHCVSDTELILILRNRTIDVIDIFKNNSNDTMELIKDPDQHFKNWDLIKISHLNAGSYHILWDGLSVMSYRVLSNTSSAKIFIKNDSDKMFNDGTTLYLINGKKLRLRNKNRQIKILGNRKLQNK